MKKFINYIFFLILLSFFSYNSQSNDLTRQKEIEKVVLLKGERGKIHFYDPNELVFKTGNLKDVS